MTNPYCSPVVFDVLAMSFAFVGALIDVRSRRIPNWVTGPAMLLGILLHSVAGGWKEGANSLLGLLLCGGIFIIFYVSGGMGAGDVKFIAAEASLLGLSQSTPLLFYTVLSGGIMGLALALRHGKIRHTFFNMLQLALHHGRNGLEPHPDLNVRNSNTLRLPYGVAIGLGCTLTLLLQRPTWMPS